ncbi:MAG: ExeM/NucH family extracellular endonuclease [Anaerolineales bacterium]|nr:ExeM/NucH family extracellular endonuclease [Anaerolineales bacterium]
MILSKRRFSLSRIVLIGAILMLLLSATAIQSSAETSELFISEYGEGSGYNKYIEIYNGTGAAVDLSSYAVWRVSNGGAWPEATINLSGTLGDGQILVVYNPGTSTTPVNTTIATAGDLQLSTGTLSHNGDDAIGLAKSGILIDAVGEDGADPGSGWDVAGTTNATADHVLVRKDSVCTPSTNWTASRGTNPTDSEWIVLANEDWSNIGIHTANCGGTSGPVDPVINEFVFNHTGTDTEAFIEVFGDPSTDYSGFTVLEIEGDSSGAGVIDAVLSVGTTDTGGFWIDDEDAENGTVTLLLVEGFSGGYGVDIDTDNDGVIDSTPWVRIVDDVAVSDGDSTDHTYAGTVLDAGFDGGSFTVGGASRIPNGTDTDTTGDWVRNDFDGYGFPGFVGSQQIGEAINTPGAVNEVITVIVDPEGVCDDPATKIYYIQGSGLTSADAGNIREVEGVVVGDFQNNSAPDNGDLNGFHLQDPMGDGDPATSDGVFIYAPYWSGLEDVAVGDVVRVRGSVSEHYGLTEINATKLTVCSSGNELPDPTEVSLPVTSVDDFEAFEGMLVTFPQELVISEYFNFDRYGEIVLTSERHLTPTAEFEPGVDSIAAANAFLLDKITLDDGRTNQNPDPAIHPDGEVFDLTNLFRGGDTVSYVTGVIDYSYSLYRLQPTMGAEYFNANPRTENPDDVGGSVKVASFNVLNYFTTIDDSGPICGPLQNQDCRGADDFDEFTRQRDKIIAAISAIDADVVGLIEIENYPGDVPVADLVSGLNDVMGAGTYDYVATGAIGTDAIRQAFIYKPADVTPMGDYAVLDSSVDARFLDDYNRPALAQTFIDNSTGGVFTVVVNHLKSKGSDCNAIGDPDLDDGAGNCNLTRKAAAEALVDWLATDPTSSFDEDFLIIGDLNSYDKEDPIDVLLAGADDTLDTDDDYADLVFEFLGEDAYSYVFDGQIGYLDHGLANNALDEKVSGLTIWHINADEPDLIDYDTSFKQDAQDALYAPDAYRSSDHDPVIVGLGLTTEQEIYEMMDYVQALVDDGWLNDGQGNSLLSKLENSLAKLEKGQTNAVVNQLAALINELEDFVYQGLLTPEQAEPLIKSAGAIVYALGD